MNILPAIDLYEGQVVRLKRGEFNQMTVYAAHPELIAEKWQSEGCEWLHVVDLEGAKSGVLKNIPSLKKIRAKTNCKIEFGGGIRTLDDITALISEGVSRVILGTRALDGDFLSAAMDQFQEKIAVGLDTKDGLVQTHGWLNSTGKPLETVISELNKLRVQTIIYTDIKKDGMLQGPNFEGLKHVLHISKSNVILSGGVSTFADVQKCNEMDVPNLEGAIIGRALFDPSFSLRDAVNLTQKPRRK